MSIVFEGEGTAGSALSIICRVDVVDRLVVQPRLLWKKSQSSSYYDAGSGNEQYLNGEVLETLDSTDNILHFNEMNTSLAGVYICTALIDIISINVLKTANDTQAIHVSSE